MDKVKVTIDLKNGYGFLTRDGSNSKLVEVEFICDDNQIVLTDLTAKHRKVGYGTMIMYTMMGIAKAEKKPIVLFSLMEVVPFYEKLGFMHLSKFKKGTYKGKAVRILNLNPETSFNRQIGLEDFIWVPPNLDKVEVWL